jgi:hypothetical protein
MRRRQRLESPDDSAFLGVGAVAQEDFKWHGRVDYNTAEAH